MKGGPPAAEILKARRPKIDTATPRSNQNLRRFAVPTISHWSGMGVMNSSSGSRLDDDAAEIVCAFPPSRGERGIHDAHGIPRGVYSLGEALPPGREPERP